MEENEEDMENYLDSLEYLIKRDRDIKKVREILRKLIQIQLDGAKRYVSGFPDQDKKKEYEDRIEHLEKLFYGKNEEDEESNCLPCYG